MMFLQCGSALPWGSLGEGRVGAGVGEKRTEGKKVAEQLCSGWGAGGWARSLQDPLFTSRGRFKSLLPPCTSCVLLGSGR